MSELLGFYRHKENEEAFGRLLNVVHTEYKNGELVKQPPVMCFEKTKFAINTSKSVPRVLLFCINDSLKLAEKYKKGLLKEVDDDFFNHFQKINSTEYLYLELLAEKKLLDKL